MNKKTIICKFTVILFMLTLVMSILPLVVYATDDHTKEDYASVWSEDFEFGIPDTWSKADKDGDGFNWEWSKDAKDDPSYNPSCHGDWCVISESYSNKTMSPLNPDNWLYLPSFTLKSGKEYLLTFMMAAQDVGSFKDKVGVYISTDGGTNYTQLGEDHYSTKPSVWEEVEVDLFDYAGNTVNIAIVHHNCYNQFITKIDCFNLWEKVAIDFVEVFGVTAPMEGETASYDWSIPDDVEYVKKQIEEDNSCWIENDYSSNITDMDNLLEAYLEGCMDGEFTFKKDKYYYFVVSVDSKDGYMFKTDVSATVNENTATVLKNEGSFTAGEYLVIYEFGKPQAPTEYDITVTDCTATPAKAIKGATVSITANPAPAGEEFDKWEVVSGGVTLENANSATTTFTMPANAVSIKATYKPHVHSGGSATCATKAICDGCGQPYGDLVAHDYSVPRYNDTEHWYECACSDRIRMDTAAHTFGEWTVTKAATETEVGIKIRSCVCGIIETETIPVDDGLSVGAIIAISVGGTVVVCVGGFLIFWFVIKKKKNID